ncbi:hypothetical protein MTR67_043124, partial [Solanum verrucosum]
DKIDGGWGHEDPRLPPVVPTSVVDVQVAPKVVLTADDQYSYESSVDLPIVVEDLCEVQSDECEERFQKLNTLLTLAPMLTLLEEGVDFIVYLDALGVGLGGVLMKKGKSLQYIFSQRDMNFWQCRWIELLKDYDITILYHLGKVNVVVDSLSRKTSRMGSLASIIVEEKPLARDVQRLANSLVRLQIF